MALITIWQVLKRKFVSKDSLFQINSAMLGGGHLAECEEYRLWVKLAATHVKWNKDNYDKNK